MSFIAKLKREAYKFSWNMTVQRIEDLPKDLPPDTSLCVSWKRGNKRSGKTELEPVTNGKAIFNSRFSISGTMFAEGKQKKLKKKSLTLTIEDSKGKKLATIAGDLALYCSVNEELNRQDSFDAKLIGLAGAKGSVRSRLLVSFDTKCLKEVAEGDDSMSMVSSYTGGGPGVGGIGGGESDEAKTEDLLDDDDETGSVGFDDSSMTTPRRGDHTRTMSSNSQSPSISVESPDLGASGAASLARKASLPPSSPTVQQQHPHSHPQSPPLSSSSSTPSSPQQQQAPPPLPPPPPSESASESAQLLTQSHTVMASEESNPIMFSTGSAAASNLSNERETILAQENKALKSKLKQYKAEVERQRSIPKRKSSEQMGSLIETQEKIRRLEAEKESWRKQYEDLRILADNSDSRLFELQIAAQKNKDQAASSTEKLNVQAQQLQKLTAEVERLSATLANVEKENQALQEQFSDASQQLEFSRTKKNNLQEQLTASLHEKEALEERNRSLESDLRRTKSEVSNAESTWTEQLENLRTEQARQNTEIQTHLDEISTLKIGLASATARGDALTSELNELQHLALRSKEEQQSAATEEQKKLSEEIDALKSELGLSRTRMQQFEELAQSTLKSKETSDAQVDERNAIIQRLEQELLATKEQLSERDARIQSSEQERQAFQDSLEKKLAESNTAIQQFEETVVPDLQDEIAKLKKMLKRVSVEYNQRRNDREELESELAAQKALNESLQATHEQTVLERNEWIAHLQTLQEKLLQELEKSKSQHENDVTQIEELKSQENKLQKQLEQLQTASSAEGSQILESLAHLETEAEQLRLENHSLEEQHHNTTSQLQRELAELRNECQTLTQNLSAKRDELLQMSANLAHTEEMLLERETALKSANQALGEAQARLTETELQLQQQHATTERAEEQLRHEQAQISTLLEQLRSKDDDLQRLHQTHDESTAHLQQEHEQTLSKLSEHQDQLQTELDQLHHKIATLESAHESVIAQLAHEHATERDKLFEAMRSSELQYRESIEASTNSIRLLQERETSFQQSNSALHDQVNSLRNQLVSLQEEHTALQTMLEESQSQNSRSQEENVLLRTEISRTTHSSQASDSERVSLGEELSQFKAEYSALVDSKNRRIDALTKQIKQVEQILSDEQAERKNFENCVLELNSVLTAQKEDYEQAIAKMQAQNEQLISAAQEKDAEIVTLESNLQERTRMLEAEQQSLAHLKNQIQELQQQQQHAHTAQSQALSQEVDSLQHRIAELENANETMKGQLEQHVDEAERAAETIEDNELHIKSLESSLQEKQQNEDQMALLQQNNSRRIEELLAQMHLMESELVSQKQKYEGADSTASAERNKFEQLAAEFRTESQSLKNQVLELTRAQDEMSKENASLRSSMSDLQQKNAELESRNRDIITRHRSNAMHKGETDTLQKLAQQAEQMTKERLQVLLLNTLVLLAEPQYYDNIPASPVLLRKCLRHWNAFSKNLGFVDSLCKALMSIVNRMILDNRQAIYWMNSCGYLLSDMLAMNASVTSTALALLRAEQQSLTINIYFGTRGNTSDLFIAEPVFRTVSKPPQQRTPNSQLEIESSTAVSPTNTGSISISSPTVGKTGTKRSDRKSVFVHPNDNEQVAIANFVRVVHDTASRAYGRILLHCFQFIEAHIADVIFDSPTGSKLSLVSVTDGGRAMMQILRMLDDFLALFEAQHISETLVVHFLESVLVHMDAIMFNTFLTNKSLITAEGGINIKMQLSYLENWLDDLNFSHCKHLLCHSRQAADVSVIDQKNLITDSSLRQAVCPDLSTEQISHILNSLHETAAHSSPAGHSRTPSKASSPVPRAVDLGSLLLPTHQVCLHRYREAQVNNNDGQVREQSVLLCISSKYLQSFQALRVPLSPSLTDNIAELAFLE